MRAGLILVVTLALVDVQPPAQSPPASAPAGPVRVDVMVLRGNDPVPGLKQADFELTSGAQPLAIASFAPASEPLTMVLLVDVTTSARMQWGFGVGRAAGGLLVPSPEGAPPVAGALAAEFRPSERVLVGAIGSRLFLGRRFLTDAAELAEAAAATLAVPGSDQMGPSPIWDAVGAGVDVLAREPRRRALLLMTDGQASGNQTSVADVTARAAAAGVSVHVLAVGNEQRFGGVSPFNALRAIATDTGGTFVEVASNLSRAVTRILAPLRASYTIGFVPAPGPGPHLLTVRVKRSGLTVRAATSYTSGNK